MNDIVEALDLKDGNVIEVYHDENPESPREWDNIGIMAAFHGRYSLTDKDVPFNAEMFEGWDEMEYYITGTLKSMVCLPLYMYDHSGITIATTPFSCNWDSGQIGYIYTTAKRLAEIGVNQKNDESWEDFLARIKTCLEGEVETFDQYVTGDVYGFQLKDSEDEEIGSCWGFYGDDVKTNGMLNHVESEPVNMDDL